MLILRTFTSCQGTGIHPQVIGFFSPVLYFFLPHSLCQFNFNKVSKLLSQLEFGLLKRSGKYSLEKNILFKKIRFYFMGRRKSSNLIILTLK
jgi:hypothetical protein